MNYKTWHITHRFNKSSVLMSLITSIGRYIVASRGSSSAANHMFSIEHQKCEYLCKISGFVTLLAGALRCVLTHSQVGNTLAVILKGQLMLPITLSRVLRSLPNNLKSTLKKVNHENIQDGGQSFQEWASQKIQPKVTFCNAWRNCKITQEVHLRLLTT